MRKKLIYILLAASLISLGGCRSAKKKGDVAAVQTVAVAKMNLSQKKIVEEAMSWLGTPYKYAGSEKGSGTDCSGMVLRVYEDAGGVKLPRNSKKQSEFCKKLKKKEVQPGDLVFFATGKDEHTISHVGIMIDDNQFIHASTKKGVILSEMTTPYYERTFIMYGRVPDAGDQDGGKEKL